MKTMNWAAVLAAGLLVAACGSDEPAKQAAAPAAKSAAKTQAATATAAEVAAETRGKVKCPAKIQSPARAANAPVDDVVGVRPGMTYEEAANVVMCTNDLLVVGPATSRGFQIQTYGQTLRQGFNANFAAERVQKSSRDYLKEMQDHAIARGSNRATRSGEPGQSRWFVGTMGMPGEERVISAAREEWFEKDRQPTLESVQQALLKKYGPPTQVQNAGHQWTLRWAYDTRSRLVTETSPLFRQCHGAADPNAGANLTPDCGVVVAASIFPLRDNPALAERMQVGVVDSGGGYERLMATEQGLQRLETERRAKQVEEASKGAARPTL